MKPHHWTPKKRTQVREETQQDNEKYRAYSESDKNSSSRAATTPRSVLTHSLVLSHLAHAEVAVLTSVDQRTLRPTIVQVTVERRMLPERYADDGEKTGAAVHVFGWSDAQTQQKTTIASRLLTGHKHSRATRVSSSSWFQCEVQFAPRPRSGSRWTRKPAHLT